MCKSIFFYFKKKKLHVHVHRSIATVPRVHASCHAESKVVVCKFQLSTFFAKNLIKFRRQAHEQVDHTNRMIEQTTFNGGFVAGFEQLDFVDSPLRTRLGACS